MRLNLAFIFLFAIGCAQKEEVSLIGPQLFPDGIYTQSVQLQVFPKDKVPRSLPFRNLVKIEQQNFDLKGFSPFGTQAFEASGNLSQAEQVKLKFYIDLPKFLSMEFIRRTFLQIQKIQKLQRSQLKKRQGHDFYEADGFELAIFEYTEKNIPKSMRAKGENWIAFIELEKYQSLPNSPLNSPGN